MKKQAAFLILSLFFSLAIFAQQSINDAVYFETAKAELTDQAKKELNEFTQLLKSYGDYSLEVKAHTDDRGDHDYNLDLSNKRANSVMNYLTTLGIESSKSSAAFFGESRPNYSNETEEGMQKNRRVDLLATVFTIENIDALLDQLSENEEQEYKFSAYENVKLTALNGTKIWIPANAFVDENGMPVTGEVTFKIEEAYSRLDMITMGLSTHSGEKLLETGGMVYMEANANGQKLELNEGVNLLIEMPTNQQKARMELFTGNPSTADGVVDWNPTGQGFKPNWKSYLNFPKAPKPIFTKKSFPPYLCDKSTRPKSPKRPRKPIKPHEPKRERFKYNPGFFTTVKLGKKKIKAEEERQYQKVLASYQKGITRYNEVSMPKYKADMKVYNEKLANHSTAIEEWEAKCNETRKKYNDSMRESFSKMDSMSLVEHRKRMEIWREAKRAKVADFENKFNNVGALDKSTLNSYFYQINEMGWINCDRFQNVPANERMLVSVKTKEVSPDEMVYIVFKNTQSIIRPKRGEDGYYQRNLPLGKDIAIIGIKVKDGRPQMAKLDTQIKQNNDFVLDYKPVTLKDMRKTLESFGS